MAKPVLSTLSAPDDPAWNSSVEVLDPARHLLHWLRDFWRLSKSRQAVVVRGTVDFHELYRDLLGIALLKLRRTRPRVVVSDATIEPGSRKVMARLPARVAPVLPALSRLLIRAADGPHVRWCVLSREELELFPRTWGVPAGRVVFTPFAHTLWHGGEHEPTSDDGYLFSGGNSLRNYDLLVDAVAGLPVELVIATGWRPHPPRPGLRVGKVSHEEFLRLLRHCRGLVLPLQAATRSTGQQTYLNAMALGKPVIVTDAPGVRDHIEDGVTGVVVPPTAEALRSAVRRLLDPAHAERFAAMGLRARERVLAGFTEERYRESLLRVAGVRPVQDWDLTAATRSSRAAAVAVRPATPARRSGEPV